MRPCYLGGRDARSPGRWLGGALLVLATGCATQEETNFGDPNNVITVGGGQVAATSTGSGPSCNIDTVCGGITWSTDIFKGIIDSTGGMNPGGGCSDVNCHNTETKHLKLPKGDLNAGYAALLGYVLQSSTPPGKYIVPCSPTTSKILCNVKFSVSADALKPYAPNGSCGSVMPLTSSSSPVHSPLNQVEFDNLVKWITCGAPKN